MIRDVAALYVDARGAYPKLVEHWYDEARDARTYAGPWPVVAHPPCGPWSRLRHLHGRPEEREIGILAVEQVRKFGGVLEQPEGSRLWKHCGLPMTSVDSPDSYALAVEQVSWGHVARKRTWLWLVGIDRALAIAGLRSGGVPTHWVSGGRNCQTGGSVPPGIKVCSAQQRRRTPAAFAEWLLSLAQQVNRKGEVA